MSLYYKKVEALQLVLTDEQKETVRNGGNVEFDSAKVKYLGGGIYGALLKLGETLMKIEETQWLVKHPENVWQILWPHEFEKHFVSPQVNQQGTSL